MGRRLPAVLTLLLAGALALTVTVLPQPRAEAGPAPFGIGVYTGTSTQVVTVKVASRTSTYATVRGWRKQGSTWRAVWGPVTGRVGSRGVTTQPREGGRATPVGTFTMQRSFGTGPDPGTRMLYRTTRPDDWWVSDVRSRYYNTFQTTSPRGRWDPRAGERLADYPTAYRYAVAIDVNRWPVVRGRGSAIFLHVGTGGPTAGCVSVSAGHLVQLMRWLDPAARPRIAVGVG